MKPTEDLIRLANAGASLELLGPKPTDDLIRIVTAAAANGGKVVIRGVKPIDDLLRIVRAGKGCVTVFFDSPN